MNRSILPCVLLLVGHNAFSQGYTHFQSYARPSSYHHKSSAKVWLSAGKNTDNRMLEYDLSTRDFIFLNDSAPVFRSMVSDNNNGVGISQNSQLYYTSDNWKTINTSAQTGIASVYKTGTGFLGLKEVNRQDGEFYYSADGNSWTKVALVTGTNYSYRTKGIQGSKVWLVSNPASFQVSYDGGATFENKQGTGIASVTFIDFFPLDTLNAIGVSSNGDLYRTSNGGSSWNALAKTQIRLVLPRIDSLIAYHPVEGLLLSTDTGNTWAKVNFTTPTGFTSQPALWNASGAYITTVNGTGFFYTDGFSRPWKQLKIEVKANRCVGAKGRIVMVAGESGYYAYSHNQGRTFVPGESPVGSQDIFACEVINDTLVMMADRQSNIFVSQDGGISWRKAYSNTFNFIGIKFRYSADLSKIILRRAGQLVFSKNGGITWETLGSVGGSFDATVTPSGKIVMATWYGNTMQINEMKTDGNREEIKLFNEDLTPMGIEMVNDQVGYCFGIKTSSSEVYTYKTTDGWNTFTLQGKYVMPGGSPIFHMPGGTDTIFINFRNTSNADASLNTIYQTFDGGKTWSTNTLTPSDDPNYRERMQSIHFFNTREYISLWDDSRIYLNKTASDTGSNPVTFVRKIENKLQAVIYPNPAQSVIYIESPSKIDSAKLYDLTGRTVWIGNENQIPVSGLPAGIYYLELFSGDKHLVSKVVKQ